MATALILAILLYKFFHGRKRRYHPFAGTFFNQVINFGRLHDYHTDLARKYKTFRIFGVDGPEVYTADPANVEHILKTNFNNYNKVIRSQTQYLSDSPFFSLTDSSHPRPIFNQFVFIAESTH